MHLGSKLNFKSRVGDNLEAEVIPFSFAVQLGTGEEIGGAAHAFTPDVTAKIYQILHENERYMNYHDNDAKLYIFISSRAGRLSWHGGVISSEYGLKFVAIRGWWCIHNGFPNHLHSQSAITALRR